MTRSRRSVVVSVLLAFASSHAGVAYAQKPKPKPPAAPEAPPPPASPPSLSESLTGEAKADYDAAKLLYGNGDYAGALVKFTAAHDKSKDPRLLWNLAACEKNLRHYVNLLGYVRRYLAEGDSILTETEKSDARALLKATEALTTAIDLSVSESGARVFVDDTLVGDTPLAAPIVVDVGPRKIRIEKEGFDVYREEITAGDTPRIKLVAKLEKTVNEATLTVYTARPKDEIYLDGTLRGLGTWRGLVPSGGHTLRVSAPEMRSYQTDVFLHDKETRTISITLEREREPARPAAVPSWVWIGGAALAVTGLAIGGYFLFKPEDKQPELPVGTLDPGSVQASFPGLFRLR